MTVHKNVQNYMIQAEAAYIHECLRVKLESLPKTPEGQDEARKWIETNLPRMQDLRAHLNMYGLGKAGSKEYAIKAIISHWVVSDYMLLCDAIMGFKKPGGEEDD